MKFLSSHCSIVCSYCPVVCLTDKRDPKNDRNFKFFKVNEVHIVDSPLNEDPKIYLFSKEALISGEAWSKNLEKTGTSREFYGHANHFEKRTSAPYQTPCDASIFLHVRPNFRKKMRNKLNFQAKI